MDNGNDDVLERHLQLAFFNWIEFACPDLLAWSVPNGAKRDKFYGALLKKMGLRAGVHDVHMIPHMDGVLHTIELKNPSGRGILSDSQKGWGEKLKRRGGKWAVAKSGDEIMAVFDRWGIKYKFPFPVIGDGNKKRVKYAAYHEIMMGIAKGE